MKILCARLRCGDDLLGAIQALAEKEHLEAAVVLSAVGCVSAARVRDAGGINLREIREPCEIVSLTGTVSRLRCHLHIALSKEDLSTVGGHLVRGCTVNTTCELVLGVPEGWRFGTQDDPQTGYDEIVFERIEA